MNIGAKNIYSDMYKKPKKLLGRKIIVKRVEETEEDEENTNGYSNKFKENPKRKNNLKNLIIKKHNNEYSINDENIDTNTVTSVEKDSDGGLIDYNNENLDQVVKEALSKPTYNTDSLWWKNSNFQLQDASKLKVYLNEKGQHYTHIYSYNKLMTKETIKKMSKILNKTEFKILAWYFNPTQTIESGLTNIRFICRVPMQTTSTEKFSVYIYMKY